MVDNPRSTEQGEPAQKPDSSRWCWECRRRRLVCDCARPVCNTCRATGVVCPGYGDVKPLKWLLPGTVLSRVRKPRKRHAGQRAAAKEGKEDVESNPDSRASSSQELVCCRSTTSPSPGAWLRTDLCDLAEAAMYYNSAIYPDLVANQLAPNPFVVPVLELETIPPSMRHSLITMAFSHRIYRSAGPVWSKLDMSAEPTRREWWMRVHHHRGLAIRFMNEDIGRQQSRASDRTIIMVLVFLLGELQQSLALSNTWRHHVNGLKALFELRGGFEQLTRSAEGAVRPSLLAFLLLIVVANTTSPASDQVAVTSFTHVSDLISDLYGLGGMYPLFPCAQYLVLAIAAINHLRARSADRFTEEEEYEPAQAAVEARALLNRVAAFFPEEWVAASQNNNPPDFSVRDDAWLLAARIYHCAVTLYCISSLQSLGLLPRLRRAAERDRLMVLLADGLARPRLRKSLLWPLLVAGFEARQGSDVERGFVARRLEELSRELGMSQPLVAKAVFERFWAGPAERWRWDDCFDRPYAFLG